MSASPFFSHIAQWTSRQCGRPLTFGIAFGVIVVWGVSGPVFKYSDTWQLVINTGTTVVTFLMVFLIQNTQNRDASAVKLKLDELIRTSTSARNKLLTLEDLTEAELDQKKKNFARKRHHDYLGNPGSHTTKPRGKIVQSHSSQGRISYEQSGVIRLAIERGEPS